MLPLKFAAFVLASALTAAPLAPAQVNDVTPSVAAIGTSVTVTGSGFGAKKPAVLLTSSATGAKQFPLKVTSFDPNGTSVTAVVASGVAGTFDVTIKAPGVLLTKAASLQLSPPAPSGNAPTSAGVGTSVALNGTHFGTKIGKVSVGGKAAKVIGWNDSAITFVVPTTVPNGPTVVDISNTLGATTVTDFLTVTGSSTPLGKDGASGKIGGKAFKPLIHFVFFTNHDYQVSMTELGAHARTLAFHVFNLTTQPTTFNGTEQTPATLTLSTAGGGPTLSGAADGFSVAITHFGGDNRIAGFINGTVTDGTTTQKVEHVQFVWTIGP